MIHRMLTLAFIVLLVLGRFLPGLEAQVILRGGG